MDSKSHILTIVFVAVLALSVFMTYKRAYIDKDFIILPIESTEEM